MEHWPQPKAAVPAAVVESVVAFAPVILVEVLVKLEPVAALVQVECTAVVAEPWSLLVQQVRARTPAGELVVERLWQQNVGVLRATAGSVKATAVGEAETKFVGAFADSVGTTYCAEETSSERSGQDGASEEKPAAEVEAGDEAGLGHVLEACSIAVGPSVVAVAVATVAALFAREFC